MGLLNWIAKKLGYTKIGKTVSEKKDNLAVNQIIYDPMGDPIGIGSKIRAPKKQKKFEHWVNNLSDSQKQDLYYFEDEDGIPQYTSD